MPRQNPVTKVVGPAFIKAGNYWISVNHIASIHISPEIECVTIRLSNADDIRLENEDSIEFQTGFDAVTIEIKTP